MKHTTGDIRAKVMNIIKKYAGEGNDDFINKIVALIEEEKDKVDWKKTNRLVNKAMKIWEQSTDKPTPSTEGWENRKWRNLPITVKEWFTQEEIDFIRTVEQEAVKQTIKEMEAILVTQTNLDFDVIKSISKALKKKL